MPSFRLYHVLFAIGVTISYFTAEELGLVHAWTGYVIGGLLLIRMLLGLASMRGFEFRRLLPRMGKPPLGQTGLRHPVIGAALTLALFSSVLITAGTGIAMDGGGTLVGKSIRADDEREGRGRHHDRDEREDDVSFRLITPAYADDGEGSEEEEGLLGEVHETFGNLLLPLALLHAVWLLVFRFEMARFMLFIPRRR